MLFFFQISSLCHDQNWQQSFNGTFFCSMFVTFWTVCQPFRCATEASGLCWPGPSQRYILLQNSLRNHSWNSKISSKNHGSFFRSRALNYFSVRKKENDVVVKNDKNLHVYKCSFATEYYFTDLERQKGPHIFWTISNQICHCDLLGGLFTLHHHAEALHYKSIRAGLISHCKSYFQKMKMSKLFTHVFPIY